MELFYIDIKILDKDICKTVLGGNIEEYYSNIHFIMENQINCVFRIPMIGNYVATEDNLKLIIELLKGIKPEKVELLEAHNLASSKYKLLGMQTPDVEKVNPQILDWFIEELLKINIRPVQMKL